MRTIRIWNQAPIRGLRYQKVESDLTYKLCDYVIESDGCYYNSLTGEVVTDVDFVKDIKELVEHWFMVPDGIDIPTLSYFIRQDRLLNINSRVINTYTIYTTMKCNAGCDYCFQKGLEGPHMSADTAKDVSNYILGHSDLSKPISLAWFGGEPLMNKDAIDIICKELKKNGVSYSSSMTTNGDLLDKVTDGEVYLWNLKKVQLTVDAPGEEYDKEKHLPAGAYDRLKASIERLSDYGIEVSLRVHYHPENGIEQTFNVIDDFKDFKNLKMYAALIYGIEHDKKDYEDLLRVEDKMIAVGKMKPTLPNINLPTYCMGDNPTSTCITVDGSLSPCEHYSSGESYGTIYSDNENVAQLSKWRQKRKYHKPYCKECVLYPSCEILENCPSLGNCEEGYSFYLVEKIKRAMRFLNQ